MANGQTLDPRAKVSDKQIKCLVSGETNATQGSETRKFGVKGRVNNAEITTTISITEIMSRGFALLSRSV